MSVCKYSWWSSLVVRQAKVPVLSLLGLWLQLWLRSDPWTVKFHMPQVWPKQNKTYQKKLKIPK